MLEGDIYDRDLEQSHVTSPTFLTMKRSCFDVIGTWNVSFQACYDDDICFRLAKHFRSDLYVGNWPCIILNTRPMKIVLEHRKNE